MSVLFGQETNRYACCEEAERLQCKASLFDATTFLHTLSSRNKFVVTGCKFVIIHGSFAMMEHVGRSSSQSLAGGSVDWLSLDFLALSLTAT